EPTLGHNVSAIEELETGADPNRCWCRSQISSCRSMAFEQYYAQEWKSVASAATTASQSSLTDCFDCNICFDFAREPVVTLCGHLYCWPCIYKWLHVQTSSHTPEEHPQCPVCKAGISHTTMVPLYGRGGQPSEEQPELETKASTGINGIPIPPRPPAYGTEALSPVSSQLPYRNHHYSSSDNGPPSSSSPLVNLRGGGSPTTGFHHPAFGVFGEFVYARVFGNSDSLYTYPNSYQYVTSSSSRLRRQEMQAEKSLNRISIFLFCCFILCLMVF
ncbi:E3 ubiquitin-protein ligase RMA1H1, partial [Linum perenne]